MQLCLRGSNFPWNPLVYSAFMSNHEPFRLDGLTALVTGGAQGIGEAICRRLTWSGASVIIADVDIPKAEKLSKELERSTVVKMDVTDEAGVNATFKAL